MRRWVITGAVLVALLIAGLAGLVAFNVARQFAQPGPLAADMNLVIPRGAGLTAIAHTLSDAGVIRDPLTFRLGVSYHRVARDLKAGEYSFPAAASMRQVMEILRSGETVVRRLTVPEGLTSQEIVALVAAAEGLSGPGSRGRQSAAGNLPLRLGGPARRADRTHGDGAARTVARALGQSR